MPASTETLPRAEAARKLIHVALSLVAAAVVALLPHPAGATVLAAATLLALSIEIGRRQSATFASRFFALVGPMLRQRETLQLTGATTLAIGYTAAALLFPGWPAAAGILVAGTADPAAALVGRRFGQRRYRGGKSLEGSLAFLMVAALVLTASPGVGPAGAIPAAMLLAVIEAPTLRVDDNLYLPALSAAAIALVPWAAGLGGFS
jgi:dolichol kinase